MSLKEKITANPRVKSFVHWMLIAPGEARPRLWVKWFVNPFIHHKGKGAKVRRRTRMDVLPFNNFSLGNNSTIEDFSTINNGVGDVSIGNGSLIGMGNVIIGPVNIGNNVIFAQNIVASGLNHEYRDVNVPIKDQKTVTATITVEDDCWIAANAVLTAGVTIGKHSVVAGGAVVTKSIPPYSVAAGNPAKVIKRYDETAGDWVSVKN
ncbi:acyltransferase [Mucilaginibacter auburnensis]|uniref:Acetyltransferase-like isoleucine patch superfamily enzyme n=1 Tax=Mucilaginibacter auburnensis TaxID=1457233 RepID=A0A2H9VVZ9_9SPHI|nr:acyltransferase [Mucilaginibacter auburnensis]PJJ84959.1 acetyltransferase-like isoleucine patch superfamily enzyme [Mucilaginibacter auburnensis]